MATPPSAVTSTSSADKTPALKPLAPHEQYARDLVSRDPARYGRVLHPSENTGAGLAATVASKGSPFQQQLGATEALLFEPGDALLAEVGVDPEAWGPGVLEFYYDYAVMAAEQAGEPLETDLLAAEYVGPETRLPANPYMPHFSGDVAALQRAQAKLAAGQSIEELSGPEQQAIDDARRFLKSIMLMMAHQHAFVNGAEQWSEDDALYRVVALSQIALMRAEADKRGYTDAGDEGKVAFFQVFAHYSVSDQYIAEHPDWRISSNNFLKAHADDALWAADPLQVENIGRRDDTTAPLVLGTDDSSDRRRARAAVQLVNSPLNVRRIKDKDSDTRGSKIDF